MTKQDKTIKKQEVNKSNIVNLNTSVSLTVLEVEPVEIHPLHQVAERLGLERGQSGVADLTEEEKTCS